MANTIKVDGRNTTAPSAMVSTTSDIEVIKRMPYVSRGGLKLQGAVERMAVPITGKDAVDVGSSTGGFTDYLLQNGVKRVIAVDVGRGQLDWKLRNDERVTVLEKTNIKELDAGDIPFKPQLGTVDLSFISSAKVLKYIVPLMEPSFDLLVLVKPQFEGERRMVKRGGVVKDRHDHAEVLAKFAAESMQLGLSVVDITYSWPAGAEGNREFFCWLAENGRSSKITVALYSKIEDVVEESHSL